MIWERIVKIWLASLGGRRHAATSIAPIQIASRRQATPRLGSMQVRARCARYWIRWARVDTTRIEQQG